MIQPKDDYRNKMSDPAPLSCFAEIIPLNLLGSELLFYVRSYRHFFSGAKKILLIVFG
jgi:hypothetical protein